MPSRAIRVRLLLLSLGTILGILAVAAIAAWNMRLTAINGPLYADIADTKDLVADILPPPANIMEAELLCLQALEAAPADLPVLIQRGRALERSYLEREAHWRARLQGEELRRLLLTDAATPAGEFFRLRDDAFEPALLAGRIAEARALSAGPMQAAYERHRLAIARVVDLAARHIDASSGRADAMAGKAWAALLAIAGCVVVLTVIAALRQLHLIRERERALAAEQAAAAATSFSERILQTVGALVVVLDREGRIVRFNRACERLTGWREMEVVGRRFADLLVPEEQRPQVLEIFVQLLSGMFPSQNDCEWVARDGRRHWIAWTNTCAVGVDGRIEHIIETGVDITLRRRAETLVQESELRLRQMFDALPIGVSWALPDGRIEYANRRFASLFGYGPEVATIADWYRAAYPAGLDPGIRAGWDAAFAHPGPAPLLVESSDVAITCRDGSMRRAAVSGVAVAGRVIAAFIDLEDRVRAERSLRDSEERFRSLIEQAPLSIAMVREGRVLYGNPAFRELYRIPSGESVREMPVSRCTAPEDLVRATAIVHSRRTGQDAPSEYDSIGLRRDGTTFPKRVIVGAVELPDGPALIGFTFDLTEARRAEAAAIAAEREAVVGRMAGRVAHEVNNPLEAIKVYIEPLRRRVADRPEVDEGLQIIDQQVDRIARLIRTLLGFVRQRSLQRQNADLGEVLRTVSDLFHPRFAKQGKQLRLALSDGLGSGAIDIDEVQQVLINLIENGLAAIPRGGGVGIAARRDGPWLEIEVEDDGPGLGPDPEAAFKPFYTTKQEGTGLGLPVARRICEAHGGHLTGGNRPEGGARFAIRLRVDAAGSPGTLPGGEVQV